MNFVFFCFESKALLEFLTEHSPVSQSAKALEKKKIQLIMGLFESTHQGVFVLQRSKGKSC
jgi:hypothetical protein